MRPARELAELLGVPPPDVYILEGRPYITLQGMVQLLGADDLGGRIRRVRQAAGLSQEEAAGLVGVQQATISRWERGTRTPRDPGRLLRPLFEAALELEPGK